MWKSESRKQRTGLVDWGVGSGEWGVGGRALGAAHVGPEQQVPPALHSEASHDSGSATVCLPVPLPAGTLPSAKLPHLTRPIPHCFSFLLMFTKYLWLIIHLTTLFHPSAFLLCLVLLFLQYFLNVHS